MFLNITMNEFIYGIVIMLIIERIYTAKYLTQDSFIKICYKKSCPPIKFNTQENIKKKLLEDKRDVWKIGFAYLRIDGNENFLWLKETPRNNKKVE